MRCYKLLYIFLSIIALNSFADILVPYENTELKVGEFLWVSVESEQNTEELKSFVNKRIHDVIYVQEHRVLNDTDQYYVIVLDAPKEPSKAGKYQFEIKGFNYIPLKGPRKQEFTVFGKEFQIPTIKESKLLKYIGFTIICIILIVVLGCSVRHLHRRSKAKKEYKQKAMKLLNLIEGAKTRVDFEEVFKNKSEIEKYIEIDEEQFLTFCNSVNQIQFKKEWSLEEDNLITNSYKKMEILGIKNGI